MPALCDMRFPHFRRKKADRDGQDPAEKTQRGNVPAKETPPMTSLPEKTLAVTERPAPVEGEVPQ